MTQPAPIEQLTRQLRADLDGVWAQIVAEQDQLLAQWFGMTPPVRAHRLRAMQTQVRALADAADELAARSVVGTTQAAYELGGWATAVAMSTGAGFDTPDLDAITHLAGDTMSDLLHATRGVRESTKDLVRTLSRDWVQAKLYTGLTAEQAGVRLAADMAQRGITAIVYVNGNKVGLSTYADMVLRTRTAEAYQEGGFNQGQDLGVRWWEVFDGFECGWTSHNDPEPANGKILTLDEARSYPISHPNCQRSTSPRPDILTAADARGAKPSTTEAQRADQATAEAARAEGYRRVPRRAGLDRQVSRRLDMLEGTTQSRAAARFHARTGTSPVGVARDTVAAARDAEPGLTRIVHDLANTPDARMAGLGYRLKSSSSLARKIQAQVFESGGVLTPGDAAARMFDVNRYTLTFPDATYTHATQAALDSLRTQGATLRVKNYWAVADNPYQGVNVQAITSMGQRFEIQFHTPTSLLVKERSLHPLYELQRVETNPARIADYTRRSFDVAATIPVPPGIGGVA